MREGQGTEGPRRVRRGGPRKIPIVSKQHAQFMKEDHDMLMAHKRRLVDKIRKPSK
jgi:hypothetical protein